MTQTKKTIRPTQEEIDNFDITATVCSMFSDPKYTQFYENRERWPMYSYERPANIFWDAVGKELFKEGWTMEEIQTLLQSKYPRWALDGDLSDKLIAVGKEWAKEMMSERETVQNWIKNKE